MDRTGNIFGQTTDKTDAATKASRPYWETAQIADTTTPDASVFDQAMISFPTQVPTTSSQVKPTSGTHTSNNKIKGNVSLLVIVLVSLFVGWVIYRRLPRDFQACTQFIGSRVEDGRCTTFYNKVFVDWPTTDTETESTNLDAVLTQTAPDNEPDLTASPTASAIPDNNTSKGGLTITATIPPQDKTASAKPTPAPTITQAQPASGNWIRHNYPDQKISVLVPRNFTGSNATRNRDTQITTFKLWTTNANNPEIAFKLQPANSVSEADKNKQANTSVAGNPASKTTNGSVTTYTWQKDGVFFTTTCTAEVKMCDEILSKVTIN